MASEHDLERRIQALLDGRPLTSYGESLPGCVAPDDPAGTIDAISRAHRMAIFGMDVLPDRSTVTRWGHLEVRDEIGRGASGTVYRAWDERLAREVALKLLDSNPLSEPAALEEGRLLARLNHAHIVRVFGADTHDGVAGVWMELLEGDTLDEILSRDGVFSVAETLLIGRDLAGALSAVHTAGLLHRDIKGRNVLRERGGRVVLMDLGAGRAVGTTQAGDETGTPIYMAPEVLAGGAASVQSDIYCLGVLLYQLLTARLPVTAADGAALRDAHARGDRLPLRRVRTELTPDITTTIERACDPDPSGRYASASEFADTLAAAFQRRVAPHGTVASSMARRFARSRTTLAMAASAIVVMFGIGWASWDTTAGRNARRRLGLTVPPRSVLYLTMNSGLGIVRGGQLTLVAHNPTTAGALAVSSDLGIRTMAGMPPWTVGGSFRLDGTEAAPFPTANNLCCFTDGTTDGRFNYAARQDSTLLEPIGSRPLLPPALYRFDRDWSNPHLLFPLDPAGPYYGVAYDGRSHTFWLTRRTREGSLVEVWSGDGRRLATPIDLPTATLVGIAIDPADGTVWAVRSQPAITRLENFDESGRRLGTLDLTSLHPLMRAGGAEFAWPRQ